MAFRVAGAEALDAGGDRAAAAVVLGGALHEIDLRAALIADEALRRGFLMRREENRRAVALARAWGIQAPTRVV